MDCDPTYTADAQRRSAALIQIRDGESALIIDDSTNPASRFRLSSQISGATPVVELTQEDARPLLAEPIENRKDKASSLQSAPAHPMGPVPCL